MEEEGSWVKTSHIEGREGRSHVCDVFPPTILLCGNTHDPNLKSADIHMTRGFTPMMTHSNSRWVDRCSHLSFLVIYYFFVGFRLFIYYIEISGFFFLCWTLCFVYLFFRNIWRSSLASLENYGFILNRNSRFPGESWQGQGWYGKMGLIKNS